MAKISDDNAASLALFEGKLGFVTAKKLAPFHETHLVAGPAQGLPARLAAAAYTEDTRWMWGADDAADGSAAAASAGGSGAAGGAGGSA